MLSSPGSETGRRLLIAAGTAQFDALPDSDLPRVPYELERIAASFGPFGYERLQAERSLNPDSDRLKTLFADVKNASRAGDFVVGYYTGHGARDLERFYLLARNSTSDLDGTALPAEDLARALIKDSKATQVLVILDACYAGAGAAEFLEIANRLTKLVGNGPEVFVIAAARPKQEAEQGALSSALAEALAVGDARMGGSKQAFLAFDDVMRRVQSYLPRKYPAQKATWSSINVEGGCDLFPNPLLETQRAFSEHWVPKASGAEVGAGGWYFTGREQALRALATWLSGERSDGRPRVVTGGPGSGKSAVLGRVVTLADPTYRKDVLGATGSGTLDPATLPPEGAVNVAIHARHKLLAEVATQIATGLDLAARDPADLLAALARRPEKTLIVIDALDEADDRDQIVYRLLQPLAKLPQVFLLVGTRPDSSEHGKRFRALGEAVVDDSVPDSFLEEWQYDGKPSHYSDRFRGHSLFISYENRNLSSSILFAALLGGELKYRGLQYARHYTEEFMGKYRRELVDAAVGVYRYDQLAVLRETEMPAVLLEAGSIINRDEEMQMNSLDHRFLINSAVIKAVEAFRGEFIRAD